MKLISLRVENFILVAEARIDLSPRFNVLTGETGAGKTMLLSALAALLGGRIDWDAFGREDSVVEGVFSSGHETVLVRREISGKSRKSRAFVNGEPVSLAQLSGRIGPLVAIHGQRENQRLLDPENHLSFVDVFGGLEGLREDFANAWRKKEFLRAELEKKKREQEAIREAEELYRFQLRELEEADLKEGEDEELAERRRVLTHGARLAEAISFALEVIHESEGSASADIASALSGLSDFSEISRIKEAVELLCSSRDTLVEAARILSDLRDQAHYDPDEIDAINQRLFRLSRLKEKFRTDLPGLIRIMDELTAKLQRLQTGDQDIARIERDLLEAEEEVRRLGQSLSDGRRMAGAKLSERVEEELQELAMSGASFRAEVWRDEPSERGFDRSEFLFSAGPGQALLPLVKVASGGELSRLMLALETALASAEDTPILVFDEVDQGIGGRVADVVGKKLGALSSRHQILTVTHLPQIAARADRHFLVEKKKARVSIRPLSPEERVREIARMSAGERITPEALALAKRLLDGMG